MIAGAVADDTTSTLRAIPLFSELDDKSIDHLVAIATVVDLPKGSVLIERGLPGSGMFVILDGEAEVELRHRNVSLGPGEFVGELSLLTDHAARVARVRAASELRCLAISRQEFTELLNQHPAIALPMLSTLARRVQDLIEHPA
jgi:CRP-like cAMP-binding protein